MKNFIWLNKKDYSGYQDTFCTVFDPEKENCKFCVAAFKKHYDFGSEAEYVSVDIFADTKYYLYINGGFIGVGPVCPGGDYDNKLPMPIQYYSTYRIENTGKELDIYARVQLSPTVEADMSCGRGGLYIRLTVQYKNGRTEELYTDESWKCRIEKEYKNEFDTDFLSVGDEWKNAEYQPSVWNLKKSPILNLEEKKLVPVSVSEDGEGIYFFFDMIYAAYFEVTLSAEREYAAEIETYENESKFCHKFTVRGTGEHTVRALRLDSIGMIKIKGVKREEIRDICINATHYPIKSEGSFTCSDAALNKIFAVGKHTTDICRQTLELDSPSHQENLGCAGDYFIESLIAYYCFGDTALSRFDITRIAEAIRMKDGYMFHTSYLLIWVNMLYDNYMFGGDRKILEETEDALTVLMNKFETYEDKNGVIDDPPNYMFVDWIPVDEFNLHHPPKALGQAVLNAFYVNALRIASKIENILGNEAKAKRYSDKADNLKERFNEYFYDKEKKLYFCGLNTEYKSDCSWLPENTDRRYYSKHVNILAALYDIADDGKELVERTLSDESLITVQPYFMHFVFEAIYRVGLFGKYGLSEMRRWEPLVAECDKGMKEAWYSFPGYGYDYSHAWGSTPTYQLMSKISGLEIVEAGFGKIKLNPDLYGLEFVELSIPTPFGNIEMKLGKDESIKVPDEIDFEIMNS